jgi:phosphatidylserine/phosphatidylglycerophosphate/cardiolipin synthase-like enzyme
MFMTADLDLHLLPSDEFVNDLEEELKQDVKKIIIVMFHMSHEEIMERLLPHLNKILENHGIVELYLDSRYAKYNFTDKVWIFLNSKEVRKRNIVLRKKTSEMFEDLKRNGAKVQFNYDKRNLLKKIWPVYKSDHRKIILIENQSNSKCAYFGGTNFDDGGKNDFMVKTRDVEIYKNLELISKYFDKDQPDSDLKIALKDNRFIALYDKGLFNNSIIEQTAFEEMKNAKERIVFVTQLPPEIGVLRKLLKAEKSGTKISIILPVITNPILSEFPYNIAFKIGKILLRLHKSKITYMHLNKYTHSKILIVDDKVLVGSHNLSRMAVLSCIKEFSVLITDKKFLVEVENFIESLKK